jgi:hypothetical protein
VNKVQALALLAGSWNGRGDNNNVAELVVVLEHMPLEIVQAAAYIPQKAPLYYVSRYLEESKKSERKQQRLFAHAGGQLRRDWETKSANVADIV